MINKNEALKIAQKYLNDKKISILKYGETKDSFIFSYAYVRIENDKKIYEPVFDNSMIEINKRTGRATDYIITEHLEELNKMEFKDAE